MGTQGVGSALHPAQTCTVCTVLLIFHILGVDGWAHKGVVQLYTRLKQKGTDHQHSCSDIAIVKFKLHSLFYESLLDIYRNFYEKFLFTNDALHHGRVSILSIPFIISPPPFPPTPFCLPPFLYKVFEKV